MNKIEICKNIVENQQAQKIVVIDKTGKNRKILIDLTTANRIISIFNAVNDDTKTKLQNCGWDILFKIAYKY